MKTFIALLRGINVGGKNSLRMKQFVAILEDLGCTNVSTYIQSGNAVFQCPREHANSLAPKIGGAINDRFGFHPHVLLIERREFQEALAANPFPDAVNTPGTLHIGFLDFKPVSPAWDTIERHRKENEEYVLAGRILYLHVPEGIGRSKLASKLEPALGEPMTMRNWRTVSRILQMAGESG